MDKLLCNIVKVILVAMASVQFSCSPIRTEDYFSQEQIVGSRWDGIEGESASVLIVPHFFPLGELPIRSAYQRCNSPSVKRVILISPDHFKRVKDTCIATDAEFSTFFGNLKPDREAVAYLVSEGICRVRNDPFRNEHGILVHAPFIKYYFPAARIVPIIVNLSGELCQSTRLISVIRKLVDSDALLIVSSDFSHRLPYRRALIHDRRTSRIICSLDFKRFHLVDADCGCGIFIGMKIADELHIRSGTVIMSMNSAEVINNPHVQSTTGMVSIGFFRR
jgi:AmmeMemoRadiSam system protein B